MVPMHANRGEHRLGWIGTAKALAVGALAVLDAASASAIVNCTAKIDAMSGVIAEERLP